jgi:hypothetical protein
MYAYFESVMWSYSIFARSNEQKVKKNLEISWNFDSIKLVDSSLDITGTEIT